MQLKYENRRPNLRKRVTENRRQEITKESIKNRNAMLSRDPERMPRMYQIQMSCSSSLAFYGLHWSHDYKNQTQPKLQEVLFFSGEEPRPFLVNLGSPGGYAH